MPTQNVKHRMLVEARRIANTEFKDETIKVNHNKWDGRRDLIHNRIITMKHEVKNREISKILDNHPEFDPNTFRQMIKEIEIRNKQKEI